MAKDMDGIRLNSISPLAHTVAHSGQFACFHLGVGRSGSCRCVGGSVGGYLALQKKTFQEHTSNSNNLHQPDRNPRWRYVLY